MAVIDLEESYKYRDKRTFETRVAYILDVFSHKYTEFDIYKKCVEYKLKITYEQYVKGLEKCLEVIKEKGHENPFVALGKANTME